MTKKAAQQIENAGLDSLTLDPENPNVHTQRGTQMLKHSIQQYGAREAGVLDVHGGIVGGNNRRDMYKSLGMEEIQIVDAKPGVPVFLRYNDLDLTDPDNPAREISIGLNRAAQVGIKMDPATLKAHSLKGVDLSHWYNGDEIGQIFTNDQNEQQNTGRDTPANVDQAAELAQKYGVEAGQLWGLGNHRLLCDSSTNVENLALLMGGKKASMVFTDPPYGNSTGYGRRRLGLRYIAGDENTNTIFELPGIVDNVIKGNFCVVWVQWHTYVELIAAFTGWDIETVIVWDKKSPGLHGKGGYGEQYEMAVVFAREKAALEFFRGNLITEARVKAAGGKRAIHPTMKPVRICAEIIGDLCPLDGIVFDGFAGSGSTLIAAGNIGRLCYAAEIDPGYAAVILDRWANHTGSVPKLLKG